MQLILMVGLRRLGKEIVISPVELLEALCVMVAGEWLPCPHRYPPSAELRCRYVLEACAIPQAWLEGMCNLSYDSLHALDRTGL